MTAIQDLVYWTAPTLLHPFREQIQAAVAGGFTSIALPPEMVSQTVDSGTSVRDMKQMARDAGVPIRHLDTATDWTSIRCPSIAPAEMRARFDIPLATILSICEAFEIETILAVAGFEPGEISRAEQIDGFGRFCEAASGFWVDLEFMPMLGLPTLEDAWAVVEGVNAANAGLMIDTWHACRAATDPAFIDTIPAERLRSVQIADGFQVMRGSDLVEDTLFHRAFPGEGDMAIGDLLAVLIAKGGLVRAGPEVFSAEANALGPVDAGKRSGATTRAVLRAHGCGTPGTAGG